MQFYLLFPDTGGMCLNVHMSAKHSYKQHRQVLWGFSVAMNWGEKNSDLKNIFVLSVATCRKKTTNHLLLLSMHRKTLKDSKISAEE